LGLIALEGVRMGVTDLPDGAVRQYIGLSPPLAGAPIQDLCDVNV